MIICVELSWIVLQHIFFRVKVSFPLTAFLRSFPGDICLTVAGMCQAKHELPSSPNRARNLTTPGADRTK